MQERETPAKDNFVMSGKQDERVARDDAQPHTAHGESMP